MKLTLTPFGRFVTQHSVMVPMELWATIIKHAHVLLDDADTSQADYDHWRLFLGEIATGCQKLIKDDKFLEMIAEIENAEDLAEHLNDANNGMPIPDIEV